MPDRRFPDERERSRFYPCAEEDILSTYDIERHVLGTILTDATVYSTVSSVLEDYHFSSSVHRQLYLSMRKLSAISPTLDIPLLIQTLQDDGVIDFVGGKSYVVSLIENTIYPEFVLAYCKTILDKYSIRSITTINQQECEESVTPGFDFSCHDRYNSLREEAMGERERSEARPDPISEILESITNPGKIVVPIPTGYQGLDNILWGFRKKCFYILAAEQKVGKTAVSLNLASRIAKYYGKNVLYLSLEQSEKEMTLRLVSILSGLDSRKIERGQLNDTETARALAAVNTIEQWKRSGRFTIVEPKNGMTMSSIRSTIKSRMKIQEVDIVFVDQLSHIADEDNSENIRVETINKSLKIKQLAKALDIPIVLIVQMSRPEGTKSRKPNMHRLAESSSLEANADVIMLLWRPKKDDVDATPEEKRQIELIVDGNRHGAPGDVMLTYAESGLQINEANWTPEPVATHFQDTEKIVVDDYDEVVDVDENTLPF